MESVLPPTLTPFLTQVEIFCVYVLSTFCARSYKKAWLYAKNHTQDGKYICRLLPDSQIRARLEQVQHVVLEQALINILPTQTVCTTYRSCMLILRTLQHGFAPMNMLAMLISCHPICVILMRRVSRLVAPRFRPIWSFCNCTKQKTV
jgi:hypothetical protein